MTPQFKLDDIKNEFWRDFIQAYAEKYSHEDAVWLYCELFNRSGGEVPWIAYDPMRLARDRAIIAGEEIDAHLSPRQKRRIKQNP